MILTKNIITFLIQQLEEGTLNRLIKIKCC